ncbi:MAG: cbiJ [Clostridia bacterium]|nr:cbiJ [Clostridia bacterium]
MIWIIGGTSEARTLVNSLTGKKEFIVSVATYSGAEMLEHDKVVVSRMDKASMAEFIRTHAIDTVVDMSHPYAAEVTQSAKLACRQTAVKYIRYSRKASQAIDCFYAASMEECLSYLSEVKGCVFFTTGMKNIKDFQLIRGQNRFVYRVLPAAFSIQECVDNNVKMEDIIAILGPVSEEMNYQMFKDFRADYVVMKDSGKEGGTIDKIRACKRLGIPAIVIGRPNEEEGFESIEELLEILK